MSADLMDPNKAAPFELGSGEDAVLLIHGFTGSPWDMRPLGEALAEDGYFVKGLRLPGHGLSPRAMIGISWRDWESAVDRALADLSAYRFVFVAGLSMGALLAVTLAAKAHPRVRALALMAPAVRFRGTTLTLLRASRSIPLFPVLRPWVHKDASDIADPVALREAPILEKWPAARLYDLWRVQDHAAHAAPRVRAPTLVMVAEQDHVVSPEGARQLARRLVQAKVVELHRINQGFHIMPRDHGKARVTEDIRAFFARYRTSDADVVAHSDSTGGERAGTAGS